jgi:hypothetical protein
MCDEGLKGRSDKLRNRAKALVSVLHVEANWAASRHMDRSTKKTG